MCLGGWEGGGRGFTSDRDERVCSLLMEVPVVAALMEGLELPVLPPTGPTPIKIWFSSSGFAPSVQLGPSWYGIRRGERKE